MFSLARLESSVNGALGYRGQNPQAVGKYTY